MNKSSAELKAIAKGTLVGKYAIFAGSFFIIFIIVSILSSIARWATLPSLVLFPSASFENFLLYPGTFDFSALLVPFIIYYIISFIISLFSSVLSFGISVMNLKLLRKEALRLEDLFYGFTHHPDRIIIVSLLLSLISFGCFLPSTILFVLYFVIDSSPLFYLLGILTLIIGGIVSIFLALSFSQAYYLLADNSNKGAVEALIESKDLMQGHKGRLFYLMISFLGWLLLGALSCYIGYLWILPYMSTTSACFYLDLTGYKSQINYE